MEEEWRDIPGYEGYYQASNLGNIKRVRGKVWNGFKWYTRGGNILKPHVSNTGRLQVQLSVDGVVTRCLVHRLVAAAFLEHPEGKDQINHIDGNPLNNKVDNLEWCDQSDNEKHKIYILGHANRSLVGLPRKVLCVETGNEYVSLSEAVRCSGVRLSRLFSRLQDGKPDEHGNHWKYVV